MRLIVGGTSSGKKDYVYQLGYSDAEIFDCHTGDFLQIKNYPVIYKLNELVYRMLKENVAPEILLQQNWKDKVIVCDEIGCGIIPIDPLEREYRERTGRICCELARHAQMVERMYCGIPVRIK